MVKPAVHGFDFERWAALARSDPQGFEAERAAVLEAAIRRAPEERQRRLRGLQWRIDQVRRTTRNPLVACQRIHGMMWESVVRDGGLLDHLHRLSEIGRGRAGAPAAEPPRAAKVLVFPGARRRG